MPLPNPIATPLAMTQFATDSPLVDIPPDYIPADSGNIWEIDDGHCAGRQIFYYDFKTGKGAPEQTVLFVHGNPESSYTYREVVRHLEQSGRSMRIIAIDHIGFGLSDQARFEMVDMHHAYNLSRFVQALDLTDITLVVHDWGGPIGTGAFLDQSERVTKLVIMNTTVFPMPKEGLKYTSFPVPVLMPWTYVGHVVPDRLWRWIPPMVMTSPGTMGGFLGHVVHFIWRAITGRLTGKETAYKQMFSTKANARASRRHVKQTGVWGHGYDYVDPAMGKQSNRDFYTRIQGELIPSWAARVLPIRAAFGVWDPCGKPQVLRQWRDALPQISGHIQTFEKTGHFVEEHRPAEIAQAIISLG